MNARPRLLLLLVAALSQPSVQLRCRNKSVEDQRAAVKNVPPTNSARYKYEIKTFNVPVDHFNNAAQDTFKMRYLIIDIWAKGNKAPIFFYTGNEGDILRIAKNTGFVCEIASQFGALVIYAEHRYYGESLPYGNKSFADPQHLGYLTPDQAMTDYVELIVYLKSKPGYNRSPVIVFGGSYAGMFSAWMRIKYPHIVQGAIAASAPLKQTIAPCGALVRIVTSDFRAANPTCPQLIRETWSTITNVTSTNEGKEWLSDNWKLCEPLKSAENVVKLKDFLKKVYINLAVSDYPYETDFLTPLPGNPVNVFCQYMTDTSLSGKPLLLALHRAVSVYTNYTGKASCMSTEILMPSLGGDQAWNYQLCTELVVPMCTDGINDMFEPAEWNLKNYNDTCFKKYSVSAQPDFICERYGCNNFPTATNIVFSNGLLDPWMSGGILKSLSSLAVATLIPNAAHHFDLRESHCNDSYDVVKTRKFHKSYVEKWIEEHKANGYKNTI